MPLEKLCPRLTCWARCKPAPVRYAGAGLIVGAFLVLRLCVFHSWLPAGYPFLLSFMAVLVASSLFKLGPGLFSVALSALLGGYWLDPYPVDLVPATATQRGVALALFTAIAGAIAATIGTMQQATETLRQAEAHRSLLLREFRHRTRNDLTGLVSLMRLRGKAVNDQVGKLALEEVAAHAMALARVHTWLASASPGIAEEAVVDTAHFLVGLMQDISVASGVDLRPLAIRHDVAAAWINTERAVTLGLMLNEMVTNALKYAFPGDDASGTIDVTFARDGADFVLCVVDNGVGCEGARTGLGTRLLRGMASQLRGTFDRSANPGGGTVARVRFPIRVPTILPMPALSGGQ